MKEYLQPYSFKKRLYISLPYEDIFQWISKENWLELTRFHSILGEKVRSTVKEDLEQLIKQFERIPGDALPPDLYQKRRQTIQRYKKMHDEFEESRRTPLGWIKTIQKTKEGNKDFLDDLNHAWRRSRMESKAPVLEYQPLSLEGTTVFISGRVTNMEEDREVAYQYLKEISCNVLRVEDRASPQIPEEACMGWVDESEIYIGIFGGSYGSIVQDNKSATELEFDRATKKGIPRLIFVRKGKKDTLQTLFLERLKGWVGDEKVIYVNYIGSMKLKKLLNNSFNELIRKAIIQQKRNRV